MKKAINTKEARLEAFFRRDKPRAIPLAFNSAGELLRLSEEYVKREYQSPSDYLYNYLSLSKGDLERWRYQSKTKEFQMCGSIIDDYIQKILGNIEIKMLENSKIKGWNAFPSMQLLRAWNRSRYFLERALIEAQNNGTLPNQDPIVVEAVNVSENKLGEFIPKTDYSIKHQKRLAKKYGEKKDDDR